MKNIKLIAFLILQLAILQISFGQSEYHPIDNNGRTGASKSSVITNQSDPVSSAPIDVYNGISDFDVPGSERTTETTDYQYPLDLDIMQDEMILNTAHPAEIVEQLNNLKSEMDALRAANEELRLENKVIRESLGNCCSTNALNLTAKDAYLLQNSPNPYFESTEIKYFIPDGLEKVELQIRNVKGEMMKSIAIKDSGYGSITMTPSTEMSNGVFIYTLSIADQVIDSKVMIQTNRN